MSEDNDVKPSIDDIVTEWFVDHGKRFRAGNRKEALFELIDLLLHNGYTYGYIVGAEKKIMDCLVGPRSPRGASGLAEWKRTCQTDLRYVISKKFNKVKRPSGPVQAPAIKQSELIPSTDIEATQFESTIDENTPDPDIEYPDDLVYDDQPVLRPMLDRSRFSEVQTTEILPVDEFLAILEREKNER